MFRIDRSRKLLDTIVSLNFIIAYIYLKKNNAFYLFSRLLQQDFRLFYWFVSDRYIILSVNEDGITLALELAQVLDKICLGHNWRPRRSLIFCMSFTSSDICPQALPTFIWRRAMAYVTVHGHFVRSLLEFLLLMCYKHYIGNTNIKNYLISANNHAILFGSDIMRSLAVEAIRTIPGDNNWTYLEHEVFGPRLSLDIPQVIFSFVSSLISYKAFSEFHQYKLHLFLI